MPKNLVKNQELAAAVHGSEPSSKAAHHPKQTQPAKAAATSAAIAHTELEIILMRQLADSLAMPVFIVNHEGALVFYNEPAEVLLGQRFEETGELTMEQWATAFVPTDSKGHKLEPDRVP